MGVFLEFNYVENKKAKYPPFYVFKKVENLDNFYITYNYI